MKKGHSFWLWMVYSLGVRAPGLEYGGREFESRSLHLKPETKLCEERGLSGCRKGLKTVPLAQALLSLKPAKTKKTNKGSFENKFPLSVHILGAVHTERRKKIISIFLLLFLLDNFTLLMLKKIKEVATIYLSRKNRRRKMEIIFFLLSV